MLIGRQSRSRQGGGSGIALPPFDFASSPSSVTASTRLGLVALILVAVALRLVQLNFQPLWWDEGYSLYFATETPAHLLELTSLDIHPPLYYLLLQAWMSLAGIGATSARWFSVLVGAASVPLMWYVSARFLGRPGAWLATLLLVVSPFHVYYSQEVRMYGLAALFALLSVAAWQQRRWWLLGLTALAGLLTHYYFIFLLVALGLLILHGLRTRQYVLAGPLQAGAIVVLGFVPWLLYAGPRLVHYVSGKLMVEADVPMTPLQFLPRHLVAWSVGHLSPGWEWIAWGGILFTGFAVVALWFARRAQSSMHELLILWGVPTLGVFLVGLRAPFVDPRIERQLLFVLPFFLMLVTQGIMILSRSRRWLLYALLIPLLLSYSAALWSFYTVPRYSGEDYRPLLAHLAAHRGPGDAWLAIYPWQIGYLRAYLPEQHPTPIAATLDWEEDGSLLQADIDALLAEHSRVWLPAYQVKGRLLEEKVARTLERRGVPVWNKWYSNTRLYLFAQAPVEPATPVSIGEFDEVGEVDVVLGASQVASGVGVVPLFLETQHVNVGIRATVQLVGHGSVWGEWDGPLEEDVTRAGLPISAGTPPGEYDVRFTLYREADGRLLDRFADNLRQEPVAQVGRVSVIRSPSPISASAMEQAVTRPVDVVLGDRIRLVGASLPVETAQQGEQVPLSLFWQALHAVDNEFHVFVQLQDAEGQVHAAIDLPAVQGAFPTEQWQAGDLIRDPHNLALPPDIPPGTYRLIAGLYDPESGARLHSAEGRDSIELGSFDVAERPRILERPDVGAPIDIPFGQRALLQALAYPEQLEPQTPVEVQLLWQAAETGGSPLRAFVQLYRGDEQLLVSDHELEPPATSWIAGEWIVDPHLLGTVDELPPGAYRLITGLYDPSTGQRLRTAEGEWLTIATWTIEE